MTLKFPLINIISNGHLPLVNKTACLNFAKNIDDSIATRICYEMMKCDDVHEAARFLEEAVKVHREMIEDVPAYFAESSDFASRRNAILLREGDMAKDVDNTINPYNQFMSIVKTGGAAAGIVYLLKLSQDDQSNIMRNLKMYNKKLYGIVQDSLVGRALHLKKDPLYYKRLFNSKIRRTGFLSDNEIRQLSPADRQRISDNNLKIRRGGLTPKEEIQLGKFTKKIKKGAGIAAAVAAGAVALAVFISYSYKKWFSKEAKACAGVSGKARSICMIKARIKACEEAIKVSQKALLNCNSSKDEQDCMFKMKVEIRHWTKKKAIEEEKLRKLTNVNSDSFDNTSTKNNPFS